MVRRAQLIPLVVAVVAVVLLVGPVLLTFAVAYAAVVGLVAVALRVPGVRRSALAAIGVLLLLASLRPAWGVAGKRDLRYTFSLATVAQLSDSTTPGRPPQSCSWLTGRGPEALCAPDSGRQRRFFLLATAPALIGLAIVLGAGATAPRHYPGVFHVLLMATSFATLGVLMVLFNEGAGLAAFRGATVRFGGTGLVHAVVGALALLAAMRVASRRGAEA
ncbi:MAG: hypothetical protein ACREMR_04530 [Gemmatimonadales bacterium]